MLRSDVVVAASPPESVFPDGCAEVVLNLADPFLHFTSDTPAGVQPAAMIVGPTTRPMRIAPSGGVDVVGIRFEPHGVPVMIRIPAEEQ